MSRGRTGSAEAFLSELAREHERYPRPGRRLQVGLHVCRRLGSRGAGAGGQGSLRWRHFERQYAETPRAARRPNLRLYQVHSLTIESGAIDDQAAAGSARAAPRGQGLLIGITTTGPRQARHHPPSTRGPRRRRAAVLVGAGHLESARAVGRSRAREASAAGWAVIVKEAVANGRLTARRRRRRRADVRSVRAAAAAQVTPGRTRHRDRARATVGLGRAERRCTRRAAREQPACDESQSRSRFPISPSRPRVLGGAGRRDPGR